LSATTRGGGSLILKGGKSMPISGKNKRIYPKNLIRWQAHPSRKDALPSFRGKQGAKMYLTKERVIVQEKKKKSGKRVHLHHHNGRACGRGRKKPEQSQPRGNKWGRGLGHSREKRWTDRHRRFEDESPGAGKKIKGGKGVSVRRNKKRTCPVVLRGAISGDINI